MPALLFKEMGMSTAKAQLELMGHPRQPFPLRLRARHGREGGKDGKDQRTGRTAVTVLFSRCDTTIVHRNSQQQLLPTHITCIRSSHLKILMWIGEGFLRLHFQLHVTGS